MSTCGNLSATGSCAFRTIWGQSEQSYIDGKKIMCIKSECPNYKDPEIESLEQKTRTDNWLFWFANFEKFLPGGERI